MRKLGKEINQTLAAWESSSEEARINLRIRQVRDRYRRAIEEVYKENAQFHLAMRVISLQETFSSTQVKSFLIRRRRCQRYMRLWGGI